MRQEASVAFRWMPSLVIWSLCTPAAASVFEAGVSDSGNVPGCTALGPSPASGSWSNNTTGTGSSSASASADGLGLGASASATSTGFQGSLNSNYACFEARAFIDDVIVTGPGVEVDLQVSAIVDGWVTTAGSNTTDGFALWYARLQIGHYHQATPHYHDLKQISSSNHPAPTDTAVGVTLTSSVVTLPTDEPLIIEMVLAGRVNAQDAVGGLSALASIDIDPGMSLPTSGPVFVLPAGYTANSADGNIVDNEFIVSVPALSPAAMWLLGSLLAALGSLQLRWREPHRV